jgi:hypothetical protein
MSNPVSINVTPVVTSIVIVATSPAKLVLNGDWIADDGTRVRTFQEDVTSSLTTNQQSTLDALVTKAQTWIESKT